MLGAKLSTDPTETSRLLNAHLENCLYKEDGLAVLPQGTPTNNFEEQKSGFQRKEAASIAYFRSDWLPETTPPFGMETDEMRLRRLLGLSENLRFPNGHHTDMEEALRMNGLLWHATWGYYLLQFFTPDLSPAKREQLRHFFPTMSVAGEYCRFCALTVNPMAFYQPLLSPIGRILKTVMKRPFGKIMD